jgi:hypothetical protein
MATRTLKQWFGVVALLGLLGVFVSACNPTIDEEIAGKCGLSESEYQRAEAILDKGHDGMSIRAGRCRLTRKSKDVTEGSVEPG